MYVSSTKIGSDETTHSRNAEKLEARLLHGLDDRGRDLQPLYVG